MPKVAKALNAMQVKQLKHDGRNGIMLCAVGGVPGLYLQISPTGARSWILRATVGQKRRDIGLGSASWVGLADARLRAAELRRQIDEGRDPVQEREKVRAELALAQRRSMTFREATERYLTTKIEVGEMTKHKRQWRSTLTTYALPFLGDLRVDAIEVRDVLRVLEPIWQEKTETASRLRQRIEAVLSWATVAGHREGDNPARWKGNLAEVLPRPTEIKEEAHQPAVSQADAPRWWAHLKAMNGKGAQALRFVALTASRTGEVRGLTWREVEFESGIPARVVIPAKRMKAKRPHVVPLSAVAVDALREVLGIRASDEWPELPNDALVFEAPRGGMLSDMSVSAVMRRMHEAEIKAGRSGYLDPRSSRPAVPHGIRSTFRDWAGRNAWPRELAEEALAHTVGDRVEASYAREHLAERRQPMMEAWSEFLEGKQSSAKV